MDCKLEINKQEGEGVTGIGLCCSVIYKKNKYSTILSTDEDYVRCQKPEQVILPKFCANHIMTDTNYTINYNETDNLIEVIWPFNKETNIILTLHCMPKKTSTIEELLTRIEELEDRLNMFETILTHTYPKWSSFEEFTKLDGYKYFQAVDDPGQFDKPIPEITTAGFYYIYKEGNVYYREPTRGQLCYPGNQGEWHGRCYTSQFLTGYKNIGEIKFMDELQKIYDRTQTALPMINKYSRSGEIGYFITKELPMYLAAYFNEYVYGWCLLNPYMCINYNIMARIEIDTSKKTVSIVLLRTKYKHRQSIKFNRIQGCYTGIYGFPRSPTFVIDGITY